MLYLLCASKITCHFNEYVVVSNDAEIWMVGLVPLAEVSGYWCGTSQRPNQVKNHIWRKNATLREELESLTCVGELIDF